MIQLKRKEDCCGCHACKEICPKKCISMREDSEGFLYPETDAELCIDCRLCEKVCPVINKNLLFPRLEIPKVYAAQCDSDELRLASASGGAFTMLAQKIIADGGVVFGSKWNGDFSVAIHDFTETPDGLAAFRGSKYLQSVIGNTYKQAQRFLNVGRKVLFTGTPCQIAGLRRFLRKEYENLLAVDIACHSVPSPKVWSVFWQNLQKRENISAPTNVLFRKKVFDEKRKIWNCAMFSVETTAGSAFCKPLYSTPFGKGFGGGLFSRPSCHECPAKGRTSGSDITIGDFWGVEKYYPSLKSNEGLSVVICNTSRGNAAFESVKSGFKILQEATYAQAVPDNGGLKNETHRHQKRDEFFAAFNTAKTQAEADALISKFTKTAFPRRVRNFAFRCAYFALSRTGTLPLAKKLLKK